MTIKADNLLEISLNDGSKIRAFDDYIGRFIKNSKDYYEKNILDFFKEYISPSSVIFDIGSNIGNHTLYFSKHTEAKSIFSFEPSQETFKLLTENISQNQLNNVAAFNVGVGHENMKATLFSNKENMGASYLQATEQGEIKVVALDSLDLPSPNFIKIDVEGFEQQVLQGAIEVIKKSTPVIWIEIFDDNYIEVDRLLAEQGYIQIDRCYDNYIYVHPQDNRALLEYAVKFKERPLKRFTEHAKETNRKYRNVTSKVTELTQKLNNTLEEQATKNELANYEHELRLKSVEQAHLTTILNLESKITRLECDKNNTLRLLGGHGDINSNIAKLHTNIREAKEERQHFKNLYFTSQEKVITLSKELDKNREIHQIHLANLEVKNNELSTMLTQLQNEIEAEKQINEKHNSKIQLLINKESIIAESKELLKQSLNEKEELKEILQASLNSEENALKQLLHHKEELARTNAILSKTENELSMNKRKYLSLKKSNLGKLTLKYWSLRKKLRM